MEARWRVCSCGGYILVSVVRVVGGGSVLVWFDVLFVPVFRLFQLVG
jgi:hypothetical protein